MNFYYIYIINIVLGIMEAVQSPASSVALGLIVPEDKYEKISGLSSVSENVSVVLYPMLASAMMGFWGIASVLMFDIATFLFAITVMFFFIQIPKESEPEEDEGMFDGFFGGVKFLKENKVKMLFYSAVLSFVFGDLLMAFGQNVYIWSIAGIAASLPILFTMAVQSVLIYTNVREDMQGRVFAVNNAMKFAVIPMGILLGGALSEYLFEPFVNSGTKFSSMIVQLLGF